MPWRDAENNPLVRSEFTGQMISTASEEWRHECEVAYLLGLSNAARDRLLDGDPNAPAERGIKAVRGSAEVEFLRAEVERLAQIRRSRANAEDSGRHRSRAAGRR